jgi:CRISPR/Cas system-associated protein Cas5 (RAMP superfamily)
MNKRTEVSLSSMGSREEFGKTENIQEEIAGIETALKIKIIVSLSSEVLIYLPGMSLLPDYILGSNKEHVLN